VEAIELYNMEDTLFH